MPVIPEDFVYIVYLDANVLVDIALKNRRTAANIDSLLELFDKFGSDRKLRVVTSQWSVVEAEGALYEIYLERDPLVQTIRYAGQPVSPRNTLPPHTRHMNKASSVIQEVINELSTYSDEAFLISPSPDPNFWRFVAQISREVALFPPDALHLAVALSEACSMIVTSDRDFLDKSLHAAPKLIKDRHKENHPGVERLHQFVVVGLNEMPCALTNQPNHKSAFHYLKQCGFKL